MVKHTQAIRRPLPTNYLSVFEHFAGLALKRLINISTNPFCHLSNRNCQNEIVSEPYLTDSRTYNLISQMTILKLYDILVRLTYHNVTVIKNMYNIQKENTFSINLRLCSYHMHLWQLRTRFPSTLSRTYQWVLV